MRDMLNQNRYDFSSNEICTKIISEIKNRLIEPLMMVQSIADSGIGSDYVIPKIVSDFEKTSKKIWTDIKKEVGISRK